MKILGIIGMQRPVNCTGIAWHSYLLCLHTPRRSLVCLGQTRDRFLQYSNWAKSVGSNPRSFGPEPFCGILDGNYSSRLMCFGSFSMFFPTYPSCSSLHHFFGAHFSGSSPWSSWLNLILYLCWSVKSQVPSIESQLIPIFWGTAINGFFR